MSLSLDQMKGWWNDAARWNARAAILSSKENWNDEDFFESGIHWREQWENLLRGVTVDGKPVSFGGQRMLDFGCGLGRMTRAWRAFYADAVGVDISQEMIALANEANRDEHITFQQSESYPLPFADGTFSLVFSTIVIQHIPMPHSYQYISEFFRICSPQGIAAFDAPSSFKLPMGDGMFTTPFSVIQDLAQRHGMQLLVLQAGAVEPVFYRYIYRKLG